MTTLTKFSAILLRFFHDESRTRIDWVEGVEVTLIVLLLPIVLPLAIVVLLLHLLNKAVVDLLVWMWWLPRGKDVLYVSSDSLNWKEYMEAEIFPLVAERAVVLNRSGRSKWPKWSFPVRVFDTFGSR